jgi:flagellar hook-associated protein 1 FlgK
MSGLFGTLQIAKRGLLAHRFGMDVIGHNISNANTEGYSKQRVNLGATTAKQEGLFIVGQGVDVQSIIRQRDELVDRQIRFTKSKLGYSETQNYYFSKIEGLFPEPSDYGLQAYLSNFFSELRNVSNNPKDLAVRNTFVQSAVTLSKGFNDTITNLHQLETQISRDIDDKVTTVNTLLTEVHELNTRIAVEQGAKLSANDLKDQRDLKLDELSKYLNIHIEEDDLGIAHVTTNGISLVRKNSVAILEQHHNKKSNGERNSQIIIQKTGEALSLKSGELNGGLDVYNKHIPDVNNRLNTLTTTFMNEINAIHRASYSLSVNGSTPVTGLDLFQGNTAGSMSVNELIEEDVTLVSISTSGDPGDSEGALSMLNLETANLVDSKYELNEYYGFIIADIGLETNASYIASEGSEISLTTFEGDRDSVSGVSIDEELADLIRVQRSFESSAKVVSTVDRLLDTIMNMKA